MGGEIPQMETTMKPRYPFLIETTGLFTVVLFFLSSSLLPFDHKHSTYNSLLTTHVQNGFVDYKALKKEEVKLDLYLKDLSQVTNQEFNSFSREEKLCFWINAYNAFTLKLILDHYPLKSIRNIGILPGAAWKKDFFSLLGSVRNLDWIEHSRLRVDFSEPKIHFAIVCASIGCPKLISEAYVPSKLINQLNSSMENFLSDTTKNRYEPSENTLYISKIFDWFSGDFTKQGTLISFLKKGMKQEIPESAKIRYTDYDWSLNERQ
jgi:hypothetical protein